MSSGSTSIRCLISRIALPFRPCKQSLIGLTLPFVATYRLQRLNIQPGFDQHFVRPVQSVRLAGYLLPLFLQFSLLLSFLLPWPRYVHNSYWWNTKTRQAKKGSLLPLIHTGLREPKAAVAAALLPSSHYSLLNGWVVVRFKSKVSFPPSDSATSMTFAMQHRQRQCLWTTVKREFRKSLHLSQTLVSLSLAHSIHQDLVRPGGGYLNLKVGRRPAVAAGGISSG